MTDDTKDSGGEPPPHVISLEDEKRRRENERAERSAPEEVVAELGQLDAMAYDQRRKDEARKLGVRVTTLDAQVQTYKAAHGLLDKERSNASGLKLTEPEPWDDPVDGCRLLDDLVAAFQRYLALPDGAAEALTLWVVHTHAHDAADVSPRAAFTSPELGCGKSTSLAVLRRLVPRPLPASNISPAAVFRAVEAFRPTLLIDELDAVFTKGGNDELRGILNSGHFRDMAFIIRTVGDDHEPKQFSTWAPMATAAIGKIPATLEARSIAIDMRRRRIDEHVERLRPGRTGYLDTLARQCARWAADNADDLAGADPEIPEVLLNRAGDNWRPLIAIADRAGGEWPEKSRQIAVKLSDIEAGDAHSVRTHLLADLRDMFANRGADRLRSADICAALAEMEERPWPEWRNGKPITARQVAKLLAPFHIRPRTIWIRDTSCKGYELADFYDSFSRYLPDRSVSPSESQNSATSGPFSSVRSDLFLTDGNRPKPAENSHSDGLTDGNRGVSGEENIGFEDDPEERAAIQEFDGEGGAA